jgi:hypothetical protein
LENLKEKNYLGIRLYGRIILKMKLKEKRCDGVDCIHLDVDRGQWRALLNMEMNLRVPLMARNFLTS